MKLILAFIKPHKLPDVTLALHDVEGLTGASVSEIRGFGRGALRADLSRTHYELVDYVPHVRLEIACRDDLVERAVEVIQDSARTGLRGDGKIYVSNLENAIRISTKESGEQAV